ncbi:MAG: RNA chaperone Hfq [Acidobacteriia bacterium]|nr:RNA chaperone Hfq [Terriglobia bacterium]
MRDDFRVPGAEREERNIRVYRPSSPPTPVPLKDDALAPRKLIRTTMEDVLRRKAEGRLHINEKATATAISRKAVPVQTDEEFEYLNSLSLSKTPVAVKMVNGEVFEGWIEYIDKKFIRLTRLGKSNLFIYKHEIRYLVENPTPGDTSNPD